MKTFVVTYCWLWIGLFSFARAADPSKPALHTPVNQETGYNDAYFIWKLSVDPDGDAVVYDLYLGTDPVNIPLYQDEIYDGFGNEFMVGLSDGENFHLILNSLLPDNTTYYWKVVARDGSSPGVESETWSFLTGTQNDFTPSKPIGPVPTTGATSIDVMPALAWDASTDADGDLVVYDVYLDTIPNPAKLIASGLTENRFRLNNSLKGNKKYYWKVAADDGRGKRTDSDVWHFTTANTPPQAVDLLLPEDNSKDIDYHVNLSWQKAFDSENDIVYYELWYGPSTQFDHKLITPHTSTFLNVAADTRYYWKVTAVDQYGGRTESPTWNFTTRSNSANHSPQTFELQAPANASTGTNLEQVLQWSAPLDADQDGIYYDIYAGSDPSALVLKASGLTATTFLLKALQPASTYYWKVIAYDKRGGTTESDTWNFTTTSDDVGLSALSVYYRYRHLGGAYEFQSARQSPAFNPDSTLYKTKGRTTMTQAVAVVLYYSNPSTVVSFDLPPSFTVTQSIIYNAGLPADATSTYMIEGDFSTVPEVVVHLQAGQAKRSYTVNFAINELPDKPIGLTPADEAEHVSVHPTFTWKNGDDTDGSRMLYRIFMGTSPNELASGPPVLNKKTYMHIGNALLHSVKYYWKIVVFDADGESRESDVYSFVTERMRTRSESPVLEYPRAVSTYMETDFELVWRYDPAKNATYDLYFGLSSSPNLIAQGIQSMRYPVQGLSYNTPYYWKVVAHDQDGNISASPVQTFRTKPREGNETGSFTDSRDGQVYEWVKIGDQKWMVHNLAYEPDEKDGYDNYSYSLNTSTGGKEYLIIGHNNAGLAKNGYLYNWVGAMNATSNPTPHLVKRGVCPSGWHLPTLEEWNKLYPFLAGVSNGQTIDQNILHHETWPVSGKGNNWLNHTGISLLPSGYKSSLGIVNNNTGRIWLADAISSTAMAVEYRYESVEDRFRIFPTTELRYVPAASVRCIENSNQSPLKPVLKSPGNTSQSSDFAVTLEWHQSTDAEGDLIQYTLFLDNKAAPLQIIADNLTSPVYTVNGLADNTTYYWKVFAKDSYGNESGSDVWSFTTPSNTGNYAPAAPVLILPAHEATAVSLNPVLDWTAVTDPNGDPITYDVYYGADANNLTLLVPDVATTTFSLNKLTSSTRFFWKVIAKDGNGGWTESALNYFTTLNTAPDKPELLTPGNGVSGALNLQEFSWRSATDVDGDIVTYSVYLGTSPSNLERIRLGLENSQFSYRASQANTTYYWRVVASDGKGGDTASDLWSFRTFDYTGTISTTLATPGDHATGVSLNPTLEWNRYPSDLFTYDLYVGVGTSVPALVAQDFTTTTSFTVTGLYGDIGLRPHTTYQWKVLIKNGHGAVNETATWSFTTRNSIPSVPNLSLPVNNEVNLPYTATLQWQESMDADGDPVFYDVYVDTAPDPVRQIATALEQASFTLPAFLLRPATTYYWKVVARDRFGGEISSEVRQFTTQNSVQNNAPAAPVLVAPSSYTANVTLPFNLEWEASLDIDDDVLVYDVYMGLAPGSMVPIVTDLNTLSYILTTPLQPHSMYYWKVVARDNKGGAAQSLVWQFFTPNQIPSAASLISPVDGEQLVSATTTLTWHPASDADGDAITYTVYLDKNPQPVAKVAAGLTSESFTTPQLENNTKYYWRVVASDSYGGEASSDVYQFQSMNENPSAPVLQSPANSALISSSTATLSWLESTDPEGSEVGYEVFLDTQTPPQKKMGTVYNALAFATSSLTEHTTYYWKVVAKDNYGGIAESVTWSFTYQSNTTNLPPTTPVLQAPADQDLDVNQDVTLSWLSSNDPEGSGITYAVYLSEEAGATTLVTSGLLSTHYTLYNLEAGKRFFWRVVATDEAGNTSTSAIWQFTTISTFTLSGTVTDDAGSPLSGVALQGFSNPVFTNANGYYEAKVPAGWTGSLVPVLSHYTFTPAKIDISSVQDHISNQDFIGANSEDYLISGTIQDDWQVVLPNVELTGFPTTVITDEHGSYAVAVPTGWSGEIVPVLASYSFIPEKRVYTDVHDNATAQDYVGTYTGQYTISGLIADQEGNPLEDVVLHGFPEHVKTNAAGRYTAVVPAGWGGEVTPVLKDHAFDPAYRNYSNVNQHDDDQDYLSVVINSIERGGAAILSVYPNPATETVRIQLNKVLTERASCVITGNDGREIMQFELQPGTSSITWDVVDQLGTKVGAGLYHCRIFSGMRSLATAKIIILRH